MELDQEALFAAQFPRFEAVCVVAPVRVACLGTAVFIVAGLPQDTVHGLPLTVAQGPVSIALGKVLGVKRFAVLRHRDVLELGLRRPRRHAILPFGSGTGATGGASASVNVVGKVTLPVLWANIV